MTLTPEQQSHVLSLYTSGWSDAFIATDLGVTLGALKRAIKEDPLFFERVVTAKASADSMIDQVVVTEALNGSVSAAIAHKSLKLREQAQKFHMRNERRKTELREQSIKAKITAVDHIVGTSRYPRPAFTSVEQIDRYERLSAKIGSPMTPEEVSEYNELNMLMFGGTQTKTHPALLNHVLNDNDEIDEDESDEE